MAGRQQTTDVAVAGRLVIELGGWNRFRGKRTVRAPGIILSLATAGALFGAAMASAAEDPRRASRSGPRSSGVIWLAQSQLVHDAIVALHQGEMAEAIALSEEALHLPLEPEDEESAVNNLCVAYMRLREYDKALEKCIRLTTLAKSNWRSFNNRANVYLQTGRIGQALADYQESLRLARTELARAKAGPIMEQVVAGQEKRLELQNRLVTAIDVLEMNIELAEERKTLGLQGVRAGIDDPDPAN